MFQVMVVEGPNPKLLRASGLEVEVVALPPEGHE